MIPWRRDRLPTPLFLSFPCGSAGKESTCNEGDLGLIPGLGRFPCRKERLFISVFWPTEFHGLYSPWGRKEMDTTEQLSLSLSTFSFCSSLLLTKWSPHTLVRAVCFANITLRHYFANKGPSSQSYGFSSGHVWMWELDYKESWTLKNWCFWTVVLEKTLKSPLDWKEIQPVHSKGNQP